jgi:nucleoside-diphosphate-sugar epimerase
MSRWMVRQLTNSRWFDISAARQDLGYEPQVSMEDGMGRLKAWIEEQAGEQGGQRRG